MAEEPPTDLRSLWDDDDPSGSEERFRSVVQRSTGTQRELALTQLARALGLQDRFEEAHATLDALHADDPEVRVRRSLERGRLLRSAGDPEAAGREFAEAAELARTAELEEPHVDALHMLAILGRPEEQVPRTVAALEVARSARDPRARDWDATLLNNLGMVRADAGDFEAALDTFEEGLRARERIGDPARTRVARWMVAWALRTLGRNGEARSLQLALREELRAVGSSDRYVDEELALLGPSDASTDERSPGGTVGA